jgi:LuxR family quorum-sensing system transcriptional regulator SolR
MAGRDFRKATLMYCNYRGQKYELRYLDLTRGNRSDAPTTVDEAIRLISQANLEHDAYEFTRRAARTAGFDSISYGCLSTSAHGPAVLQVSTPLPLEVFTAYHERGLLDLDELVAHCATETTPGIWKLADSELLKAAPELAEHFKAVWATRVFWPVHGANGEHGMLAFNSGNPDLPEAVRASLPDIMIHGQMLAHRLHEYLRKTGVLVSPFREVKLNERELEILTYAAKGDDTGQISSIVGVTADTVKYHVNHAIAKMGAKNRLEAVARAVHLGIIAPFGLNSFTARQRPSVPATKTFHNHVAER